ncbi:hypothetical protein [Galbibacter sp. BG1]
MKPAKLILIALILTSLYSNAQYSEVNQINNYISKYRELSFLNNQFKLFEYDKKGRKYIVEIIDKYDIDYMNIGTSHNQASVRLYCKNGNECSTRYLPDGKSILFNYFYIPAKGYSDAKAILNLLKPYFDVKDTPKKKSNNPYFVEADFSDIELGMSTNAVVSKLKNKNYILTLDTKEIGYEVYRVFVGVSVYFFYFNNGKLSKIDTGVTPPNTQIDTNIYIND